MISFTNSGMFTTVTYVQTWKGLTAKILTVASSGLLSLYYFNLGDRFPIKEVRTSSIKQLT